MKPSPCPNCGNETILTGPTIGGYFCYCEPCLSNGPTAETPELAVKAWNDEIERIRKHEN